MVGSGEGCGYLPQGRIVSAGRRGPALVPSPVQDTSISYLAHTGNQVLVLIRQ